MVHGPMVHSVWVYGEALMASCQAMLFRLDAGSTRSCGHTRNPIMIVFLL